MSKPIDTKNTFVLGCMPPAAPYLTDGALAPLGSSCHSSRLLNKTTRFSLTYDMSWNQSFTPTRKEHFVATLHVLLFVHIINPRQRAFNLPDVESPNVVEELPADSFSGRYVKIVTFHSRDNGKSRFRFNCCVYSTPRSWQRKCVSLYLKFCMKQASTY